MGSHESFQNATRSFRELFGQEIPVSAARTLTLSHAHGIETRCRALNKESFRALPQEASQTLVAQADGSMVATVAAGLKRNEKRPRQWREARLVCAENPERKQRHYAASFESVDYTASQWGHCASRVGRAQASPIHVVADGAGWIERICFETFEEDATFLLDFFHVSEYLADASSTIRPKKPAQWLRTQQKRLKKGQYKKVLKELSENLETPELPDEQAPVRRAHRYLNNRQDHLFYDKALAAGLPIGSGLIESGHKHVLQSRLKKSGAAWLVESAEALAHTRTTIVNETWEDYWVAIAA